jgi:hypothetical protein
MFGAHEIFVMRDSARLEMGKRASMAVLKDSFAFGTGSACGR